MDYFPDPANASSVPMSKGRVVAGRAGATRKTDPAPLTRREGNQQKTDPPLSRNVGVSGIKIVRANHFNGFLLLLLLVLLDIPFRFS